MEERKNASTVVSTPKAAPAVSRMARSPANNALGAAESEDVSHGQDIQEQGFGLDDLRSGGIPEHAIQAVNGRTTR